MLSKAGEMVLWLRMLVDLVEYRIWVLVPTWYLTPTYKSIQHLLLAYKDNLHAGDAFTYMQALIHEIQFNYIFKK